MGEWLVYLSGICLNGDAVRRKSRANEAVTNGVAHECGSLVDVELLHEARAVRFGRFYADKQDACNILCGFAFGDELENLAFAQSKRVSGFSRPRLVRGYDGLRDPGAQIDLA